MSAIPRQIAAVEFQADARQANQAIDSMKQEAEKCNKKVELLQERLQQGFKKITLEGKPTDVEKEIKNQQRLAKSYMEAAAALTKGAKAWDELWKHAATGNIEALTGQQIKAGVNGGKRQYDRLILGDDGDRRKALVIKEIIDQANIVLDKLKGSTNEVIETLNNGGHVADEVLQREKKGLEDMMQLTEKFSPEWQEYNRQLQAISKGLEQQIAQEKRLRGELVDANDARREAAKLDADVAQDTKQRHEAQQKIIDDAQAQMKVQQEQLNQHKETAQKYADEISNQNRQVKAQEDVVNAIKRENNERNKKGSTLNKEAREAERTAETAKRAAEKSSKAVADTTLKISEADKKVADLQAQLKNLGNTKAKPVVDTEKIEKLKTSLKGAKDELAALMKDEQAANEKLKQFGITAADTADDVKLQAAAERALKMEEESRMNLQKKSVARQRHMGSEEIKLGYTKLTGTKPEKAFYAKNKDVLNDEYWRDQAGGGSIGRRYKYLQDISDDSEAKAEFKENVGMSVKDAMKVAAQRMREIVQEAMKRGFRIDNAMNEFDESYGKGPAVKLAEYVAEFNDLVDAREKEMIEKRREKLRNIQDIVTDPGDEPDTAQERMRLAKEDLKFMASPYDSNISSQVKQQREEVASLEAELKELNETGTQSVDIDKERQRITEKLNKEKEKQTKLESDLQQQMQTAKEKIEASAHADEVAAAKRDALTKAQGESEKKLQDESKKLTELQGKRNENIAALNREKEAIKQNNAAVEEQAKVIHHAQQNQAQNRQLSIESIEKAIELLRQENRVIGDETNPQWVENEKTIGRLNQRLSDMKQHAAELRGEVMPVSQAMDISHIVSGQRVRDVEPVDSRVERATAKTRETLANIEGEIDRVNGDMDKLNAEMDKIGNRSTNLNPFVESLQKTNTLLHEQEEQRKVTADGFAKEAEQRQKAIAAQKEQVELLKSEKQSAVTNIDQRIQAMQARMAELQGYEIRPKDYKQVIASVQDEIKKLEEEKAAIENSAEAKQRFADANRKLAQLIKEDSEATASEKTALEKLDEKIANTQSEMKKLADSVPGFELDDIQRYAAELSKLNEILSKQKKERNDLGRTFMTEKAAREKAIQAQRDEIALMRRQKEEATSSINARIEAGRKMLETLNALPSEQRINGPAKGMLDSTHQTIRELYAQRSSIIKESDAKIEQATSKYASLMKANEEATAKAEATLRKYNEQIYATQQQISEFAQKLSSVKGPVDVKEFEESSKQMDELKNKLASLTAERQEYTDQLQRETEEATRLAEAEKTAAEAEQKSISIEQMEKAIGVLQQAQRTTNNNVDASRYANAIDNLTQKLREAKGEAVSLEDALSFGKQGFDGSFKGTNEQLRQAKQILESTLATTAKGSDQYKAIREALAGIAIEEKRVGEVSGEVQKILDAPKGRSFNELKVAVEQGRKALNDMSRTTKEGQKAYDELAEKVRNADLEMKNLGNESKGTTSAFEKAVSRLKTYITLYMGTAVAIQKIGDTMGDTMTLSDKMGEVRKTTGFTADQVGRLSDNLAKLDTRTPIQDLMDMAAAAGQLGLNTEEDVRGFTEAANMLHVALPELGEESATEMMKVALATGEVNKIRKQMEDGTVQGSSATAVAMEKIASTIDRLRATTAAAAQPVTDFVKRVGAVGAQSGITVDQVAALGATVDELGMGTEMAATAISRMIPAIKNHAFDIAQAIGVTPKTIRDLYDSGKAMDVILMILQHIHEQNLNPDGIEKLLGTGGMGEIMKELDQQGARAGIVFAGLSQNVGELRKNLGTAKKAYADNIAIQQEYDKMNDTTAARWERLKNQLQEFFVNDSSQRFFGGIISALRVLVNLITDDGPIGRALRYTAVYLAMLKAKWTETIGSGIMYLGKLIFTTKASTVASTADATAKAFETTSTIALGNANATAAAKTNLFTTAWRRLNAAQKANVIAAVAMAVVLLTMAAIKYVRQLASMTRAQKELNKVRDQAEVKAAEESGRLENLRKIVNDNTRSMKERKAAILEIQKAVPHYIATVNGEGNAYKRNTKLLTAYIKKLKEKALVEGAKEEMQSLGKEIAHTTVEITKQETAIKDRSKEAAGAMQARPQTSQGTAAPVSVQARAAASMEIWGMKSKLRSLQNKNREANDALQTLQDSFGNQIAESDLANSLGKKGKGNGNNGNNGGNGGNGNGGTGGGGIDKNNPWGANPSAASTDWKKFNANELVARRKQMNDFVKSLQGDTDVESVLAEDPALMQAIKNGKVKSDADSVINWYNTQRLAIQNVLHSRFLTNTGNWQDPKQAHRRAKSISKLVKDDMAYYMDEIDAYYTEQKSQIENAQNSGEITEEEGWRRMLQNEQVYRQKRAELQQLYSKNSKEVTQQEADTIYEILADRTGDSVAFIKSNIGTTVNLIKQVGDKSAPAMRKIYGDLDKSVEQDFLKMRTALKKQLDAIQEIISKERPFDGIVKNLRQNVEKMGLLYTDLDKRKMDILASGKGYGSGEMQNLNAEYGTQRNPRLTFLLQQSEDAYSMTWERMANDMRVSGFEDWLDAINSNANADELKEALLAQLRTVYDTVQDAIKREASEVKKQVDIAWNDTTVAGDISMKQLYEKASSALGMEQSSVSRANSLINAGPASERVADRLAIKQMQVQLNMQDHYYALVRKTGQQRIDDLERQAKLKEEQGKLDEAEQLRLDAKHAKMSLNLTLSEEEADLAKQRADLAAKAEESENRLYTSLKEWGTLLSSSMQSLFEASNTGAADYYNNLAKMRLTGEGSAGGAYVVIDNAGTKDAAAHYENLDGEEALKRQLEIEQHNSVADAWKKVMDDINKKISDQITDWMNAALQTQSIDANTAALEQNTAALYATRPYETNDFTNPDRDKNGMAIDKEGKVIYPIAPEENPQNDNDPSTWPRARRKRAGLPVDGEPMDETTPIWQMTPEQREEYEQNIAGLWTTYKDYGISAETEKAEALQDVPGYTPDIRSDEQMESIASQNMQVAQSKIDASNAATQVVIANNKKQQQSTADTQGKEVRGTKSTFAAMAAAMNMYGIAYQTMSNDNMSSTQKFLTFALQSAGQVAIAMLTTNMLQTDAQSNVELPGILGKAASQLGPIAGPIAFAAMTATLGGLMAMAMSKVSKSKSQIAQVTGASVSAGRLSTGMLTYAEGNVNEFTDPSSLTPGQQYNVDAADGKTYRARYMGANPTTHLTNGPEFHLVGERGREAIIDANTTRQIQMNDTGIWQAIQTLYNGGRVRATRQRGGGMSNFADGNLDEFADGASAQGSAGSAQPAFTDMLAAIQASLDRNSEVMEKAVSNGIKGVFNVYGKGGIIDSYDTGKKNVERYGEKY